MNFLLILRNPRIWLILIIVLIVFTSFRKSRPYILGILGLLIFAGFIFSEPEEISERAKTLIPINQINLAEVDLQPNRGVGWNFIGEISNQSSYTLTGFDIELIVQDCKSVQNQDNCSTIEKTEAHIDLSVNPNKQQSFTKRLYLREFHPEGQIKWSYHILSTEAKVSKE
ncbi:hypothetical protein [Candidatus Nitrosacidococcus tergens]|uniref:DUF2393 domain-containing protein n=1 Tax=Candidatus Nitrosacidococcus tergens TaxID=553981 RepID=A0A7G1Q9E9_9GAMM|nr:hypothetical protein [Candidatus Nitrosacidococcus tergens]CAB1275959.1 conserved protein of unknown function [Candidatus Nitrosacidococcus tergens]